jgi:hypothetical protein
MTAEELNLPPRFDVAMKRRLGRLGVFVEVNGKYYLSEERLKQIEELSSTGGAAWEARKKILTLRKTQIIIVALFVAFLLASFFVQSWELELRAISILFLVVWLIISLLQTYYVSRMRKRIYSRTPSQPSGSAIIIPLAKQFFPA